MNICKLCGSELEKLEYYYDDSWGYKGSMLWDIKGNTSVMHRCPYCKIVYAIDNEMIENGKLG